MSAVPDYNYHVLFSKAEGQWVGLVAEFPSLTWPAATEEEAANGIRALVQEELSALPDDAQRPVPYTQNQMQELGRIGRRMARCRTCYGRGVVTKVHRITHSPKTLKLLGLTEQPEPTKMTLPCACTVSRLPNQTP